MAKMFTLQIIFQFGQYFLLFSTSPAIHYKIDNIFLVACYPGPKAPLDFSSFLKPLETDLLQLSQGIPVTNCYDKSHTVLHAYMCFLQLLLVNDFSYHL